MEQKKRPSLTRREFIADSSAALVTAALPLDALSHAANTPQKLRMAIVGTGSRGTLTWGKPVIENYREVVEIVGLCDINRRRVETAKDMMGTSAPTFVDFDKMIEQTRPQSVVVTTMDSTHYRYIIRALELGCNVITEKPLCTDERQCQAILEAEKRAGKKVTVAFNARHSPEAKKVRQLMLEKSIGNPISVDFHEYLDTSHGADYFRRWHRLKENSGTLLVHKASHHFDQVNWWLDSIPVEVVANGSLKFYGRNNPFRSTHCRGCPFKQQCRFYWDVSRNEQYVKLYVNCESEDGYLRDGCVWSENTNIYDTMSVTVKYQNGVTLNYTANAYLPYEGQAISFNGDAGRLDYNSFGGGGFASRELRLTRSFGKSELLAVEAPRSTGGHGGADRSLQDLIFREENASDPLGLRADLRAGALASLVGIAAYQSIERSGQAVKLANLVKL